MRSTLKVIMTRASRRTMIITSIVLLLIGIVGIALPQFISFALASFAGWLLLIAGGIALYITWHGFRSSWLAWLKPSVLIAVALLILLHPLAATAALGLVLAIYFLLDGFSGIGSALELRPQQGWKWLMFNGILSLVLALVLLVGWPFSAVWMIGFFIGISLFIDGLALLMVGLAADTNEI